MESTVAVSIVKPIAVKIDCAAELAQVSRVTVYGWIKSGRLKTVPVGADKRILLEEFEEFLRSGRGAGPTSPPRVKQPDADAHLQDQARNAGGRPRPTKRSR